MGLAECFSPGLRSAEPSEKICSGSGLAVGVEAASSQKHRFLPSPRKQFFFGALSSTNLSSPEYDVSAKLYPLSISYSIQELNYFLHTTMSQNRTNLNEITH